MTRREYQDMEAYMHSCMPDAAHDTEHVMRVLYLALDIAASEPGARHDILVAACLLHDIGRAAQYRNPGVDHAQAGGAMARVWLLQRGWPEESAALVEQCIRSHRFRGSLRPESLEAKILFDADKLDVSGLMGIARSLLYQGHEDIPLYRTSREGDILDGSSEEGLLSFFGEYRRKLEHIYELFYTRRARQLAQARRQDAERFYTALLAECRQGRQAGRLWLEQMLAES